MAYGRLITFEGGEGAGKSTQVGRLADRLRAANLDVVVTREPGGTPGAESIRRLLVEGAADRWSAATELMLINAARMEHVERLLAPAIHRGAWVICDRFVDSTRVYQGLVGGVGIDLIDRLHSDFLGLPWPDLTILLDLDARAGLDRRHQEGGGSRFEAKGENFHEQVREGFLTLAASEPDRIIVVDAEPAAAAVESEIANVVTGRLGHLL
ncbi:thymidylate kinase [Arboricoccus pini]|uniref:Thymidylate kinase n=1 Tax=Arboricoccus pini TaxID=1963835 RepID=A0A212PWS4_9PROT|nr:dTMP kinase [Arboricoccus pini]SNB51479.1 thymidylate kinase [Arboricoccus pini]